MQAHDSAEVDRYINSGLLKINGWLGLESALLIKVVDGAQSVYKTRGSVGEIGIHHGRSFILLYLLSSPGERAFAIDVFEAQHLNVDKSGKGDRSVFQANLARYCADMERLDILSESSLNISEERLLALSGPARLFSVDGGHTSETALSDLRLAEATLADGGVVILNGVFQALFPGVAVALARYLLGAGKLVPFAISPDRVLLTQPQHHKRFLEATTAGMNEMMLRRENYFGHQVAIIRAKPTFAERLQRRIARTRAYGRLRRVPIVGGALEVARPAVLKLLGR